MPENPFRERSTTVQSWDLHCKPTRPLFFVLFVLSVVAATTVFNTPTKAKTIRGARFTV